MRMNQCEQHVSAFLQWICGTELEPVACDIFVLHVVIHTRKFMKFKFGIMALVLTWKKCHINKFNIILMKSHFSPNLMPHTWHVMKKTLLFWPVFACIFNTVVNSNRCQIQRIITQIWGAVHTGAYRPAVWTQPAVHSRKLSLTQMFSEQ